MRKEEHKFTMVLLVWAVFPWTQEDCMHSHSASLHGVTSCMQQKVLTVKKSEISGFCSQVDAKNACEMARSHDTIDGTLVAHCVEAEKVKNAVKKLDKTWTVHFAKEMK